MNTITPDWPATRFDGLASVVFSVNVCVKLFAVAKSEAIEADELDSDEAVPRCAAVNAWAVPKTATVSVTAGRVIVVVPAAADAFSVVVPLLDPASLR